MTPCRRALVVLALTAAAVAAPAVRAATFKATLLVPADDARLSRAGLERAALASPTGPAADAVKVALAESQVELDAAGARLAFDVVEVADAAAAKTAAAKAEQSGSAALLTDLPAAWTLATADAVKLPVLNIGAGDDALRQTDCRRNLWHLGPSERMRADALAQFLVARRWTGVLLLTGPSAADATRSATAQAGHQALWLEAQSPASPSSSVADPRERDLANPLLLTQGSVRRRLGGRQRRRVRHVLALPHRTAAAGGR